MFSQILLLYGSGFASITDIKHREIRNSISVSLLVLGVLLSLISHTFVIASVNSFSIFVVGYYMFLKNMMSAADVKLLMAVPFYLNTIVFFGILSIVAVVYCLFGFNRYHLPFAPFIFVSSLVTTIL